VPIRFAATPGLQVAKGQRVQLEQAVRRFGLSLTRWLYAPRRERVRVEAIGPAVRRELASSSPYIPADQRGSQEGRVQGLEVALQSSASGVVTVVINDLRTSYRIPANFERRAGRWQVIELRNH